MSKAKMLKDAPEHLKQISLSYDLPENLRVELKKLIATAKEQSKNSPDKVFKVRGYPGKWTLCEFPKTS